MIYIFVYYISTFHYYPFYDKLQDLIFFHFFYHIKYYAGSITQLIMGHTIVILCILIYNEQYNCNVVIS